jgi:gas vesicle protein
MSKENLKWFLIGWVWGGVVAVVWVLLFNLLH